MSDPLDEPCQTVHETAPSSGRDGVAPPAAVLAAEMVLVFLMLEIWPSLCQLTLTVLGVYGRRSDLWARVLAVPLQVVSIPLVLFLLSGTRPWQLGLTTRRLGLNFLCGMGVWLLITPAVLGLHLVVLALYQQAFHAVPEEHPLTQLVQQGGLSSWDWVLVVSAAAVAAPIVEELIFRGFLQAALARLRRGPEIAIGLAGVVAVLLRYQTIQASWSQDITIKAESVTPLLFVLILLAGLPLVRRLRPEMAMVWGSSAVFAMVHTSVWPTPVPLFVLALALGELFRRTGSLVGPIVVHAMFNGTSIVLFLIQVIPA